MGECNFCGYNQILREYEYCPSCGAKFVTAETEIESEHVKLWGGETRIATLFFVSFITTVKLDDRAKMRHNAIYLTEAMNDIEKIIVKYGGIANKIIPDNRVLGIFGVPRTQKDDLERAIECVIAVRNYCLDKIKRQELGSWHTTYGVNTGWIFFGYIVREISYLTIIGDTVNVAARISQICPADQIYITGTVYDKISHLLDAEFVGERILKGRFEPVKIYKLNSLLKEKPKPLISRFPLLGREKEFERLMNAAEEVKNTSTLKVFAITGQMGIGKTRLKEEFKDSLAKKDDFKILESYCAVEIHTPYYPFKLFFRELLEVTEFDNVQKIAEKIEKFSQGNGLSEPEARGLQHLFAADTRRIREDKLQKIQEEIFSAVRNTFIALCRKKPLVLIFEEFNRADNLSRTLVYFLIQELSSYPIFLLMVNFVPDAGFKKNLSIETINLNPLSLESVKKLVKFVLDSDIDERLVDFVFRISGGNPLFVIEAIRNVRRTQLIKKDQEGRWYLEKEKRLSFLDDLYGVVMSGVDALPSSYRLLIDYAAVVGYSFTRKIISNLLNNVADIAERLGYLVKEDYIIQYRNGDDPVYVFRHNLLRDAVYTTLPMRKRKEIHKRVADLMESIYKDCLSEHYEVLGQQFLACEDFRKAAHYFKLSGYKAKKLYAIEPALNFFNTVLRIDEEQKLLLDEELVLESLMNLCDLYEIKSDIQRMKTIAEQGRERASRSNLRRWVLLFTERMASALYLLNEYLKSEELFISAIESCDYQMSDILTTLYTGLGALYQTKNEPEKSLLNYNLAWVTAQSNNYKEGELDCLLNLSRMHLSLGNYELCLEYLNYALRELVSEKEILKFAEVKYLIGEIYRLIGNLNSAQEYYSEAFNLTKQFGFEVALRSALSLALLLSLKNDESAVKEIINFVDKNLSFLIRDSFLTEINLKKGVIFKNLKESEKAISFFNNALKLAIKLNHKELEFWCYIYLAELDEERGDDYLKNALGIGEMLKYPPLIARALYGLAVFYRNRNAREQANYYGRKALYIFDDIKSRLKPENRSYYINNPEYITLLEM
ncbi:MAG: AAA family ATPase [candidate division WOR-3 bacterium]|nr:AAA family ATPase [candidate division WOR-3 bacterium]